MGGTRLQKQGAPTALTPEKATVIIESLKEGMPYSVCAAKVGVHRDTLRVWLRKGEAGEHPAYHEFFMACEAALAEYEERELKNIGDAAHGRNGHKRKNWQASAWQLERDKRFGGKYGRTSTHHIEGEVSGVVEFRLNVREEHQELTPAELAEVRRIRDNRQRAIAKPSSTIQEADFEIEDE